MDLLRVFFPIFSILNLFYFVTLVIFEFHGKQLFFQVPCGFAEAFLASYLLFPGFILPLAILSVFKFSR